MKRILAALAELIEARAELKREQAAWLGILIQSHSYDRG